jgi:H+/Cl- antiporter ClcA
MNQETTGNPFGSLFVLARWIFFSTVTGLLLGLVGTAFGKSIRFVTALRTANPWILYGLPLAGVAIVWMYQWEKDQKSSTNMVLDAIHAENHIPIKTAPLIFLATVLTHMFGGSAGREGAALQLGGSIGDFMGKIFHTDENDTRVFIMCGMSAAFAALFGTPMAAAIFSMEVVSVGIMYYAALVPCVLSAFIAAAVAGHLGLEAEKFTLQGIPEFNLPNAGKILILAIACAVVSVLFCICLHKTEEIMKKYLPNPYLRIVVAGCLVILLSKGFRTTDYLGAGMNIVEYAVEGKVVWYAFLLKILFTGITLGGGFKGGEIVPSFFVGATFGCLMGGILHISPSLAAACGMAAVFCGVTNSPISTFLISLEMFGFEAAPFFLLAIAVSYMQSGYYGLYHSQKIVYSKTRTEFINRNTKE